jgi:ribonuclease J
MQLIIHRGSHQIGGMATEIRTASTRIIIDMGDELSLEDGFESAPLDIPGVTDNNGKCDAILLTHYHGDHTKQINLARETIPIYAGTLTKEIMQITENNNLERLKVHGTEKKQKAAETCIARIKTIKTFFQEVPFNVGDIKVTPYTVDHSAIDAYMFLIEADSKKVLYTGDFRTNGFRGKDLSKMLDKSIPHCDALVIEGTTLSRDSGKCKTEIELKKELKQYIKDNKYVFILAATTNIDRIFGAANAVPWGKYFICDNYQKKLMRTVSEHCPKYKSLYEIPKVNTFGNNLLDRFRRRGFVMMVRQNDQFEEIIKQFDRNQSIILYSMWDGYRTKEESKIQAFLNSAGKWEYWHTSGHATIEDIKMVVEKNQPKVIIPMHSDAPEKLKELLPDKKVFILQDKEVYTV